jgi:hypothetical protein
MSKSCLGCFKDIAGSFFYCHDCRVETQNEYTKKCVVCGNYAFNKRSLYCEKHFEERIKTKVTEVEIELSNGEKALIDEEDYIFLSEFTWTKTKFGYASTIKQIKNKKYCLYMHQLVLGKAPKGFVIDHINRNRLDNRRKNLRYVTITQNSMNRTSERKRKNSDYKGVFPSCSGKRWKARITFNKKVYNLGSFGTAEEAAEAYNEAAKEFFGEFACLNKIKGHEQHELQNQN